MGNSQRKGNFLFIKFDLILRTYVIEKIGTKYGINNIPPKICTYACIYCQIGNTIKMQSERQDFYNVDKIIEISF